MTLTLSEVFGEDESEAGLNSTMDLQGHGRAVSGGKLHRELRQASTAFASGQSYAVNRPHSFD